MLYSPLDIHKMSGVLFVEAEAERKNVSPPPAVAKAAEVTVAAGSASLDAAFLLRFAGQR